MRLNLFVPVNIEIVVYGMWKCLNWRKYTDVSEKPAAVSIISLFMEEADFSETSVYLYQNTRRHTHVRTVLVVTGCHCSQPARLN